MRTLSIALLLLVAPAIHALSFSTSGPSGPLMYPRVDLVAVTPGEPGLLYAVSAGGVYRSRDFGDTWLQVSAVPGRVVVFDPTDADIIYAVSYTGNPWRSMDGGATWKELTQGVPLGGFYTMSFIVDPHKPSTLYVGGTCGSRLYPTGGLYKSTDRGETWTDMRPDLVCLRNLWLDSARPYRLYVRSWLGVSYFSYTEDGGTTWAYTTTDPPEHLVATDSLHPEKSYELTSPYSSPALSVSTDGETTWQAVAAAGLPPHVLDFVLDSARGLLLLAGFDGLLYGLYSSDDGGAHWSKLMTLPSGPQLAITGDFLYVCGGVCTRLPLATLTDPAPMKIGSPAPQTLVSQMALDPHDPATLFVSGYSVGSPSLLWRSHDSGAHWESVTMEGGPVGASFVVDAAGELYAVVSKGSIWHFSRATQTWESGTAAGLDSIGPLIANPARAGWLYVKDSQLLSSDGGHTWQRMQNIDAAAKFFSFAPNGFDVSAHAGTRNWTSHDSGLTWNRVDDGIDWSTTRQWAVAASRPSTLYRLADTPDYAHFLLYRSDDGGVTWVDLHGPFDYTMMLLTDPRDDRSVWIGLKHSADGGATWTDESGNLPNEQRATIAIDASGSVLYLLPENKRSIWRATLLEAGRRHADPPSRPVRSPGVP